MGNSSTPTEADVVIVGAGMAGLYTAWCLLKKNNQLKIHLLEALPRTGGRLESDHVLIGDKCVKMEEGGMRFMKSHVELHELFKELGLTDQVVPFPMGDHHNRYFLRGKRFSRGEAENDPSVWSDLYSLNDEAKGHQPGEVLTSLLWAILRENGVRDPKKWNETATPDDWTKLRMEYTYKGILTYKWGFWAMLTDFGLTPDGIEMLYQSNGFIAPYDEQINSGCALQLLVDFVTTGFHTLSSGYSALPDALSDSIKRDGAKIHLEHKVVGMQVLENGLSVTAKCADGPDKEFVARDVVMAVTQVAFRDLIRCVPFFHDPAFTEAVDSIADMELGKINLYYQRNWWTPATGVSSGGSFTDLPLAQFYCFGTPADDPGAITIYTDCYRTGYWAQLQLLGECYKVDNGPHPPAYSERASTFVVHQATKQMKQLFGLDEIPNPLLATYRRWGVPPAGDGDHQWAIGANDPEIRKYMAHPFPDVNVYTCGESYSDDQSWVNGALRSVDQLLASHDIGSD